MNSEVSNTRKHVWPWPDSLDALIAAPNNHAVLLENESVRVVGARILPGQIAPVHTHRWPSVLFILSWGNLVRRDHTGNVMPDTRPAVVPSLSTPIWQGPLPPHSVENIGDTEIKTVQVEIKGSP